MCGGPCRLGEELLVIIHARGLSPEDVSRGGQWLALRFEKFTLVTE